MNLPRATGDGHRFVARVLWRKASQLPREQRVKVLHYAQLHAYLARALDADPDLGIAKRSPSSLCETASGRTEVE